MPFILYKTINYTKTLFLAVVNLKFSIEHCNVDATRPFAVTDATAATADAGATAAACDGGGSRFWMQVSISESDR